MGSAPGDSMKIKGVLWSVSLKTCSMEGTLGVANMSPKTFLINSSMA